MTADRAALVEKVARALCEQRGQHPESVCYRLKLDGSRETIRRWMNYTREAADAIDFALEEAAKTIEAEIVDEPFDIYERAKNAARRYDAAQIRRLKSD